MRLIVDIRLSSLWVYTKANSKTAQFCVNINQDFTTAEPKFCASVEGKVHGLLLTVQKQWLFEMHAETGGKVCRK